MPSREASLRNLEKARACWRPPRPWRSERETRVIRRLVWQWLNDGGAAKWPARAVARRLGVSHTYIQKLVREFAENPSRIRGERRCFGPATLEQLDRAQAETRQEKDRGHLRDPHRWKRAEFKIGDQVTRRWVLTKAEERRRAAEASSPLLVMADIVRFRHVPAWAGGFRGGPALYKPVATEQRRNEQPTGRLQWIRREF
jgi:AraC-like DNA-binding protein